MLLGAVYAFVACLTVHLRPFKQERHNVLEGVLHCALVIMIFLIFINPTDILLLSQFSEPRESFLVFLQIGMLLLMVSACTRTIRNEMISSQISLPSFYGICEDKTANCEGYSRDKSQQLGGLEERRYLIGRQSYCDIRVQAPTVSREHAQIQVDDNDHVWLVNLSQNNPVKVNGMEHLSRVRLSNGDQFTIGDRIFTFEQPDTCAVEESISAAMSSKCKSAESKTPLAETKQSQFNRVLDIFTDDFTVTIT
jgi:hypothetical protein